jgi:two-component system phosphate regulon sensor histidine kinase PhoR
MTKTIFRNTFLVGVLVLIVCAVLFVGLQYTQTIDENKAALKQEASYVKSGLEKDGTDYLKLLDKTNRITLIDSEGNVSYDNEYSAPLPNQGGYEEVNKAYQSGEGSAVRKSDSSGQQTIYYAIKLNDGTVLRISRPVSAVTHALVTVSPILWVLVLVLIISGILAFRAAKQIVTPINELDLDNPGDNN